MLLVKTKLSPSKIHNIGLFAAQFIPKGTMVQRFLDGLDLVITEAELLMLPQLTREYLLKYAYKHKKSGQYILCGDDARFLNHSEKPNLTSDDPDEEIDIAARDIQNEEELTVDYREFDTDFRRKLKM